MAVRQKHVLRLGDGAMVRVIGLIVNGMMERCGTVGSGDQRAFKGCVDGLDDFAFLIHAKHRTGNLVWEASCVGGHGNGRFAEEILASFLVLRLASLASLFIF